MQLNVKPVAVYKANEVQGEIAEGKRIMVRAVTHPNASLNGRDVITTPIERVGNFGVFETRNTVYMPEERTLPVVQS